MTRAQSKPRESWFDRNSELFERQYQHAQKWQHIALILKAMLNNETLPAATIAEWREAYDWVHRNIHKGVK